MPRASLFILVLAGAGCCLGATPAHAEEAYQDRLPNGRVGGCATCHFVVFFGGGPRNAFGRDFADNDRRWSAALAELDSDGDGQTNGEELGDPCATWAVGEPPPRADDVSLPGTDTSTSASPNVPACPPPVAPIDPDREEPRGGCVASGEPGDVIEWALLLALAGAGRARWPGRVRLRQ